MGPDLSFEKKYSRDGLRCVGLDEVGRGCLAGPVVAASVILPDTVLEAKRLPGDWRLVDDSKKLTPKTREQLSELILSTSLVQIAWSTPEEIDRYNILCASMIAMRRTLPAFRGQAEVLLVDGHMSPFRDIFRSPPGEMARLGFSRIECIVGGDGRSLSIAAASIVAKVYRDRWMGSLDGLFPGYAFGKHKGYTTPEHYAAIEKLGPCAIHRLSFAPFKTI